MKLLKFLIFSGIVIIYFTFTGCQNDKTDHLIQNDSKLANEFSAEVPIAWYKLYEDIDRYAPGYRPPAASRAMGYIGLAGYEAAVHGIVNRQSLGSYYQGLALPEVDEDKEYHWPSAVNQAYATMFELLYTNIRPLDKGGIQKTKVIFEEKFKNVISDDVLNRSKSFGQAVAIAIFDWSKTDKAGHEAYLNPRPSNYVPPVGPGLWKPTFPDFSPALFPYWGQVRPFAMRADDLKAKPPLQWSENPNSQFFTQVKETQLWTNELRAGRDPEGNWIAEFWSDDFGEVTFTPPGRWLAISTQVLEAQNSDLAKAVEVYAKVSMSMADAAIAVWNSKYIYNLERPISIIRRTLDPSWETVMNHPYSKIKSITPEFPAYPSGHSGFGGAAAAILTESFGLNYSMTDKCHQHRVEFRGTPRSFDSFIDMAVENAYSRVPLGVHYRMDCDEGLRLGYLAAKRTQSLPWGR
jgi:hypothetical protein